jgi:hypothetical protein
MAYGAPLERAGGYLTILHALGFDPLTGGAAAIALAGEAASASDYARLLYLSYPDIGPVLLLQALVARGADVRTAARALSESGEAVTPAQLAWALKAMFPSPVTVRAFDAAVAGDRPLETAIGEVVKTYDLDAVQTACLVRQEASLAMPANVAGALRLAGFGPADIAAALESTSPWLTPDELSALSSAGA